MTGQTASAGPRALSRWAKVIEIAAFSLTGLLFFYLRYLLATVDGNFIDEYFHIIAGRDLFERGHYPSFYDGAVYDRGALMSVWVGLFLQIFGQNLVSAKSAALTLSAVNLGLATFIGWRAMPDRKFLLLFLLVYAVCPWSVFNHTYVRFYLVVELLVLAAVALAYPLLRGLRMGALRPALFASIALVVLAGVTFVFHGDASKFVIVLVVTLVFALAFVFDSGGLRLERPRALSRPARVLFSVPPLGKGLLITALGTLAFFVLGLEDKLDFLLDAQPTHTSPKDRKYDWFFGEAHSFATGLFVVALLSAVFIGRPEVAVRAAPDVSSVPGDLADRYARLVVLISGGLFALHLASSPGLQTTRAIMYFMPLFFMTGTILLSRLRAPSSFALCVGAASFLLYENLDLTPRKFWTEPTVPSEINFIDYERAFGYVKESCQNAAVVDASPHAYISGFFGVEPDAVMSAAGKARKDDSYRKAKKGKLVTAYDGVVVLTRWSDLRRFDKEVCLIVRKPSQRHYVPRSAYRFLRHAKHRERFAGIDVYRLKEEALKGRRTKRPTKSQRRRRARKARTGSK